MCIRIPNTLCAEIVRARAAIPPPPAFDFALRLADINIVAPPTLPVRVPSKVAPLELPAAIRTRPGGA